MGDTDVAYRSAVGLAGAIAEGPDLAGGSHGGDAAACRGARAQSQCNRVPWLRGGHGVCPVDRRLWPEARRSTSTRTRVAPGFDALQAVLGAHEIMVSPTLACMPVENLTAGETRGPTMIEGVEVDPLIGWCMTYFTNFTGHPAVPLPAGLAQGLPVGMQVIGRRGADVEVFAAAAAFERAQSWATSTTSPPTVHWLERR